MSIAEGTRLGPYEIAAPIGAGGMGEVYRATDTNLKRQVAIKVLPESVAFDAERVARLQREAEMLAALNHPSIAAIYGLEKVVPSDVAGTLNVVALVMELVEGQTLADRMALGAIPVEEALPIATQIAEALEAAHERGVVHRDLKPANIKVREDGRVKVLDFGLAKLVGPAEGGPRVRGDLTLSPTVTTPAMTQAGMILGTAAYMSPEQAKGRAADTRSDVWAFGCVLYEMLTGRRAFDRDDVAETLADVMRVDPPWERLPGGLSPALVTFLKRCLKKDPRERVRDIGDVRLALAGAFDTIVSYAADVRATPAIARPLWRRALPFAATGTVVALAASAAGWLLRPEEPRQVVRAVQPLPEGGFRNAGRRVVAISPDGSHFVYNHSGGLFLRAVDAMEARIIPGTEDALSNPAFSPDGQSLVFHRNGQLRRMAVTGGASMALANAGIPFGMSWGRTGVILYGQTDGVWQVSENGGDARRVIAAGDRTSYDPQELPGGEWVLYTQFRSDGGRTSSEIAVQSPASGERRVLRTGGAGGRYLPSGHLLYATDGVLYVVPFDVDTLEITGGPVPVVEGVRSAVGRSVLPQFDVSDTGALVYVPGPAGATSGEASVVRADRAGTLAPIKIAPGAYVHVRASRDGKRLAIDSDDGGESIISIHEIGGTTAINRLTFGGRRNRFPVWSPDGQRIAFQSDREGDQAIFVQRVDGTGGVSRLTKPGQGESAHIPESWSPDGRHVAFSVVKDSSYSLWILALDGGKAVPFHDVTSIEPIGAVFSPDGRWIAYHALPPGAIDLATSDRGVFVEPFPATSTRTRYQAPRVQRDFHPVWSADGTELFYVPSTASGQLAAVRVTTTSGVTFGNPAMLPFTLTAGRLSADTRGFDLLRDGSFVGPVLDAVDRPGTPATSEVRLVFNWFEELKRLAPPK